VFCEVAVDDVATNKIRKLPMSTQLVSNPAMYCEKRPCQLRLESRVSVRCDTWKSLTGAKIAVATAWGAIIAGMSAGAAIVRRRWS
jgi:hypothetical protein